MLVADVADDLLEQVLERDDTGRAAVLVDYDGHADAVAAHLADQVLDGLALGNEARLAQDRAQIRIGLLSCAQQVAHRYDAGDLVDRLFVDRIAAVPMLREQIECAVQTVVGIESDHARTRRHHLVHANLAQVHHVRDDLPLFLVERALTPSDLSQDFDLRA